LTNLLGKRYKCEVCGTEALCTAESDGAVQCCGQEMVIQAPRAMTSSD
jgi:hypothetical protein